MKCDKHIYKDTQEMGIPFETGVASIKNSMPISLQESEVYIPKLYFENSESR